MKLLPNWYLIVLTINVPVFYVKFKVLKYDMKIQVLASTVWGPIYLFIVSCNISTLLDWPYPHTLVEVQSRRCAVGDSIPS